MTKLFFPIWLGFFASCLTILIGLINFHRLETLVFRASVTFLLFLGIGAAVRYTIYSLCVNQNLQRDELSGDYQDSAETSSSKTSS